MRGKKLIAVSYRSSAMYCISGILVRKIGRRFVVMADRSLKSYGRESRMFGVTLLSRKTPWPLFPQVPNLHPSPVVHPKRIRTAGQGVLVGSEYVVVAPKG